MTVRAPPEVHIAYARSDLPGRRIAGVTALGRLLREVQIAGLRSVGVGLPDGAGLPPGCLEDARRLAPEVELRMTTDVLPGALCIDGRWLVSAGNLRHLAELEGGSLRCEGLPVATLDPGRSTPDLDCDALLLDRTAVDREILLATVKPLDGPVSRLINRPLSRLISGALLRHPAIRPLHATFATAILGAAMFTALVSGQAWSLAAGGVLYQAASIVDGVDGEIARASFRSTRLGATLDSLVDAAINLAFLLGLSLIAYRDGPEWAFDCGAFALAGLFLGLAVVGARTTRNGQPLTFDMLKADRIEHVGSGGRKGFVAVLVAMASRDVYALVFSLLAVIGMPTVILLLYAIGVGIWLSTVIYQVMIRKVGT